MTQSHYEVGTGSWYISQRKSNYPGMTLREFQKVTYEICRDRILLLKLNKGDMITLVFIGGSKPRKYKGVYLSFNNGEIELQQPNRVVSFDIRLIDDVEIIENFSKWKV
ncbi:hypothetical protein [Niallia taxi]|uniref:hypothetical protein n=1 Tax=Niallia taxi TaxID=2499688 RepID=UPI00300B9B00